MSLVDSSDMPTSMDHMLDSRNWFKPLPEHQRRHLSASQRDGIHIHHNGRSLINFASNDYLGLSNHPAICNAASRAASKSLGSGGSRLVSGDAPSLHQLETSLARWKGFEACLIVGSGMLANMGLLQALANRHTHLFCDRLNHASLVDGARLSGAINHRYGHLDIDQLELQLHKHTGARRIIVSDGVFSMDGDCADTVALLKLAEAHNTLLLIDDAHGTGSVGKEGRGLTALHALAGHPRLIEVGTFGKAFGSYGAFILATTEMIAALRQQLRTMIYSTALPETLIAASQAALNQIQNGEPIRQLHARLAYFKAAIARLGFMPSTTAIQPLLIGSDQQALALASQLADHGFFVPAIRPPTVPDGTARLRFTLSAAHSEQQIDQLLTSLRTLL
ncbi:MAG: 8-amino-7-oxononanoate synthase [Mariprofundus sp.]|nr:8-amino-7-oxononanoate synthase [Mariprofundus sp.]